VLVVVEVGLARTVDVDEAATVVVVSPDVAVVVVDSGTGCVENVVVVAVVLVAALVMFVVEVIVVAVMAVVVIAVVEEDVNIGLDVDVDVAVDGVTQLPLEHTPLVPLMLQAVPLANTGPLKHAPELQIPACRHAPEKHRVPSGWLTHEVTTLVLVDVLVDVDVAVVVDVVVDVVDAGPEPEVNPRRLALNCLSFTALVPRKSNTLALQCIAGALNMFSNKTKRFWHGGYHFTQRFPCMPQPCAPTANIDCHCYTELLTGIS
jgi:hypothetical protein